MRALARSLYAVTVAAIAAAAWTPESVLGQDFDLTDWNYDTAYEGWSVEELLDEGDVYGVSGDEIGSVENLLINRQGQIVAMIVELGGFLDVGDTHVSVPWDQITFDGFDARVPVNDDNIGEYSIFRPEYFSQVDVGDVTTVDDDLSTGPDLWKASQLIDDYALLDTGAGYGYVNDLVFDRGGALQAVVVSASDGYFAYPWFGDGYGDYGWDPGLDYYVLPFDEIEVAEGMDPFSYDELGDGIGM